MISAKFFHLERQRNVRGKKKTKGERSRGPEKQQVAPPGGERAGAAALSFSSSLCFLSMEHRSRALFSRDCSRKGHERQRQEKKKAATEAGACEKFTGGEDLECEESGSRRIESRASGKICQRDFALTLPRGCVSLTLFGYQLTHRYR